MLLKQNVVLKILRINLNSMRAVNYHQRVLNKSTHSLISSENQDFKPKKCNRLYRSSSRQLISTSFAESKKKIWKDSKNTMLKDYKRVYIKNEMPRSAAPKFNMKRVNSTHQIALSCNKSTNQLDGKEKISQNIDWEIPKCFSSQLNISKSEVNIVINEECDNAIIRWVVGVTL